MIEISIAYLKPKQKETKMEIQIDQIHVGQRMRKASEHAVIAMANSINALGQQSPIAVQKSNALDTDKPYTLIFGLHRILALQALRQDTVKAEVVELSPSEVKAHELDENLMRSELTTAEKDAHYWERKKIWAIIRKEAKARGEKFARKVQYEKGFAAHLSEVLGVGVSTVNKALARHEERLNVAAGKPATVKTRKATTSSTIETSEEVVAVTLRQAKQAFEGLNDGDQAKFMIWSYRAMEKEVREAFGVAAGKAAKKAAKDEKLAEELAMDTKTPAKGKDMKTTVPQKKVTVTSPAKSKDPAKGKGGTGMSAKDLKAMHKKAGEEAKTLMTKKADPLAIPLAPAPPA